MPLHRAIRLFVWYNKAILQTFLNLPADVSESVSRILLRSDARQLSVQAKELHERYMQGLNPIEPHIQKPSDCVAYLALRFPATYAQIASALLQVSRRLPDFHPRNVLELGCGPGTGILAAKSVWPSVAAATGLDQEKLFLSLAEEIQYGAKIAPETTWVKSTVLKWIQADEAATYDLIIVGNVLNELPEEERDMLVQKISSRSSGVVVFVEPGTATGNTLIGDVARVVSGSQRLIAPYIDNTFVEAGDHWIHFSQRFQRPEFQRRIRQSMRESPLMASDWEDVKYCYVAWGNVQGAKTFWGQCIGPVEKQKGFLTIPVLTKEGIINPRVLKRHKDDYNYVKNIRWGEMLESPINIS